MKPIYIEPHLGVFLLLWEGLYNDYLDSLCTIKTLNNTVQSLESATKKALENIVGKEENAGYQPFLLFPKCFIFFDKLHRLSLTKFIIC